MIGLRRPRRSGGRRQCAARGRAPCPLDGSFEVQFLSTEESAAWCEDAGFLLGQDRASPADPFRYAHAFETPTDSGRRVALARTFWEAMASSAPEVLVWVTGFGVWPSNEHRPLAEAARSSWGATAPLHQGPGHLVRIGESDDGLSVLVLAFLFLWDCWLLPAGEPQALFLSHDEYGVSYAGTREILTGAVQRLRLLDVPPRQPAAI